MPNDNEIKAYRIDCGFRNKVNVCNFPPERCDAEHCDFYNLNFTSKDIKERLNNVKEQIKQLEKELGDKKKAKELKKQAENGEYTEEMEQIKEKFKRYKDLLYGKEYLNKSLRYCKRAKL